MSTDEITMLKKKNAELTKEVDELKEEIAKIRTILHSHANLLNVLTFKLGL